MIMPLMKYETLLRKYAESHPTTSAIVVGFVFGVICAYFSGLLYLPMFELRKLCKVPTNSSFDYCGLILKSPINGIVAALALWIIFDWIDKWASRYWNKRAKLVVGVMGGVALMSGIAYATYYISRD